MSFPLFVVISSAVAATTVGATLLVSRWRRAAILAAFAGSAGLLLFHGPVFFHHFPVDDAYITLRYSKHLADGLGPNWNSEGRVEGYTSFLWMVLPAALNKLGLDLVTGLRFLAWGSLLATLFIVYRIWKLWADEDDGHSAIDSPVLLAAVLLAVAITDGIAYWGFSGMETPLFMFLLTTGAYLYLLERRGAAQPWSAVVFAAAAMTRPEGMIAAAVTAAFTLVDAAGMANRRRALLRVVSWGSLFVLIYGSYFLWRYDYYGELLPNTFYAKADPTRAVVARGFDYVRTAALTYHLLPLLAGVAVLFTRRRLRQDAAYLVVLIVAMLTGVAVEGGDSFGHGRFIAPLLPLLYVGGLAGLAMLLQRLPLQPKQSALVATVVLGIAGLMLLRESHNPFLADVREDHADRRVLGLWLGKYTPPDYTIAAFAVGSIAYHSDRNMLDLLGINDAVIAHSDVPDFGTGIAGHEKYNVDYVLDDVRPEIIVTGDADLGPLTTEELRRRSAGPGGLPAKTALMTDPRLWERYEARSLYEDGRWFNFLQRKDTVAELQAPGLR